MGTRQVVLRLPVVAICLECPNRQRTEQFFRHSEARQQALEEGCIGEGVAQSSGDLALGGAGRSEQHEMLASEGGEKREAHRNVALDKPRQKAVAQSPQPLAQLWTNVRLLAIEHG